MSREDCPPNAPTPPEPGWTDDASGQRAELYSLEFVAGLAARHKKIEPERVPELKRLLEGWADVFRDYKFGIDDRRHLAPKIKAELERIKRHAEALRSVLETMHPETEGRFWAPEGEQAVDFLPSPPPSPPFPKCEVERGAYGHTLKKIWINERHAILQRIERADHFEALTILRNYAATALARPPQDHGGQFRSEALRMWIVNVQSYWTEVLGQKFSYKKEAASFCIEAFRPIDPQFPQSRLVTAIRNVLYPRKTSKTSGASTDQK